MLLKPMRCCVLPCLIACCAAFSLGSAITRAHAPTASRSRCIALRAVPDGMPENAAKLMGLLGSTSREAIEFDLTMAAIDEMYVTRPIAFSVGNVKSAAGENVGSAKVFSFGKLTGLESAATLALFGSFYRKDVLDSPDGEDHPNIRAFVAGGWDAVSFPEGLALAPRPLQNVYESFGPALGQEYQSGY